MYDRILVPTDGSDHAVRAAGRAIRLADVLDATVEAVHVVDTVSVAGPFDAGGVSEEYLAEIEADREGLVEEVAALAPVSESVETTVLHGRPANRIVEYAAEVDADLIAMGTRGQTGIERLLMGSVTEQVLRQSPVPVFTTLATDDTEPVYGYSDVLVPTDGSDTAAAALDHAIEIADATDARVHSLSVAEPTVVLQRLGGGPAGETVDESVGRQATAPLLERVRDAGLEASGAVREGTPDEEILDYVDEQDVDLVVIGTHGRSGLERALVGSTAERVLRRADVPVVAVPDGAGSGP